MAKAWGGGLRKGVLQGMYYPARPEKRWGPRDVAEDTSPAGLLGPRGTGPGLLGGPGLNAVLGRPQGTPTPAGLEAFSLLTPQALPFKHVVCPAPL